MRFILTPSEELYVGKYQHRFPGRDGIGSRIAAVRLHLSGLAGRAVAQRYTVFRATRFSGIRWSHSLRRLSRGERVVRRIRDRASFAQLLRLRWKQKKVFVAGHRGLVGTAVLRPWKG